MTAGSGNGQPRTVRRDKPVPHNCPAPADNCPVCEDYAERRAEARRGNRVCE